MYIYIYICAYIYVCIYAYTHKCSLSHLPRRPVAVTVRVFFKTRMLWRTNSTV